MAAPTLVATVGAATANSYVTVATTATYLNERLNVTAWDTAVTAAVGGPERALIMATRRIDAEEFKGEPVNPLTDVEVGADTTTQALKWPRWSTFDDAGWAFDDAEIPLIVQRATMELALHYLNEGTTDTLADTGLKGFRNVKVGPLDVTPVPGFSAGDLPDHVVRLLRPVLSGAGTMSFRVSRS
jgi:hypothetical protein